MAALLIGGASLGVTSKASGQSQPRLVAVAESSAAPRELSGAGRGNALVRRLRSPRPSPFKDLMGRHRAVRLLHRTLECGASDERAAAALALARMDAVGIKGDLLAALDGARDEDAVAWVLALGELERPHLRRFLEDLAGDKGVGRDLLGRETPIPPRIRAAAALGLGLLGAPADGALLQLVFHPESTPPDVFLAAGLALSFTVNRPWSPALQAKVRAITRIPWLRSGPRRALRLALAVRDGAVQADTVRVARRSGSPRPPVLSSTAPLRPALESIHALTGERNASRLDAICWDLARRMGNSRDLGVLLDRLESGAIPSGPRRVAGLRVLGEIFDAHPEAGLIRVRRAILLDAADSPLVRFLEPL